MYRIIHIRTDTTVQVLGSVPDPMPRLAGPPRNRRHGRLCRQLLGDPPCRLPRRRTQRLDIDVRVGSAVRYRLEAGQRLAELLACHRVLGRTAQRIGQHPELHETKCRRRTQARPFGNACTITRLAEQV